MGYKEWLGRTKLNMDIIRLGPNAFWSRVAQHIKSLPNSQRKKMKDEWLAWKEKNAGDIKEPEQEIATPSAGFESKNLPKGINLDEIEEHLANLKRRKEIDSKQQSLFSEKIATLFGAINKYTNL